MYKFNDVTLERLVVHQVGNKIQEQDLVLSKYEISMHDETVEELLMTYFLSSFKSEALHHFFHETDLELNEIYNYAMKIFDHPTHNFFEQSKNIAKHLYEKSTHPNIKSGEMYLAYFTDCVVGDDMCDAIGIFKSETKDTFIKVYPKNEGFDVDYDTGINIKKLDKGCLIFDLEDDKGFKVAIVDKTNKQEEAVYWKENFLSLKPREDSYYHTHNYLNICKDFVTDVFNAEHNVDRSEQIEMLNKSVQYFDANEAFDSQSFEQEVIGGEPEIVDAFRDYKEAYAEERNLMTFDEFDISPNAVKAQKKNFKSILKLDKNFHVYIHGDRKYLEKGFDEEKDLKYYKLYYKVES